jgi:hypothetical protein
LFEGPASESGVARCPMDTAWVFLCILVFSPGVLLN